MPDPTWIRPPVEAVNTFHRTFDSKAAGEKDGLIGINRRNHELLERLGVKHDSEVVSNVTHNPNEVYDGLGEKNWAFYRAALGRLPPPSK